MTLKEKLTIKKNLHVTCLNMLQARIRVCQLAIDNAQQAANEDQKSSAGDKFETSRAMNHREKEMHERQLQANQEEMAALQLVSFESAHDTVMTGSFIECENFGFYIAAGLGKIVVNRRPIYLLSPAAPLAGILKNKKKGDVFIFKMQQEIILDIA